MINISNVVAQHILPINYSAMIVFENLFDCTGLASHWMSRKADIRLSTRNLELNSQYYDSVSP